ncbi:MAG: hypothetical protein IJR89_00705 [Clostridia bacterium]|nr:hypothetical protein [Clostridia bacterium]
MKQKNRTISAIRMLATLMVVTLHITQRLEGRFDRLHYATDWLNLGLVMFSAFPDSYTPIGTWKTGAGGFGTDSSN